VVDLSKARWDARGCRLVVLGGGWWVLEWRWGMLGFGGLYLKLCPMALARVCQGLPWRVL
jgi:hypothetical protein